jgi:Putative Flp pilus-assembly TadE/G-like
MSPKNERGQAFVLTVLAITVLLGMTALVLDVGAWFRTKRQLQATADAAALAGAQKLPAEPTSAKTLALDYADQNGGGVLGDDVTVESSKSANDTISVKAKRQDSGFFSRLFNVDVVDVGASAKARIGLPSQVRYAAPMVVSCEHEYIHHCEEPDPSPIIPSPETTLSFDPMGAPGAFGMLNFNGDTGTLGASEEATWIRQGYDAWLDVPQYYRSDPGAKFASGGNVQAALNFRQNSVLLFPVFKPPLLGQGQNAQYWIIGWIGFRLDSYDVQGHSASLTGHFTEFLAQGILSRSGSAAPNFGVKSIELIG